MSDPAEILLALLREPGRAMPYAASARVHAMRPGAYVLETSDHLFAPDVHAFDGRAQLSLVAQVHGQWSHHWNEEGEPLSRDLDSAWAVVEWREKRLEVVRLSYATEYGQPQKRQLIVAPDAAIAEAYFDEVCTHNAEIRDEVLVYANGCFNKSKELFESIRGASFDDLVLAEGLAARIRADFERFLAAREQFERWGIPWKRGALFVGPPGNGKTLCIKALVRHLGLPCLYVQSFVVPRMPPQSAIQEVFKRARRTAPCLMILEDLDSLVEPDARSFFLNELDGFASNTGLVTIGSTNHPEKLDPAIVDRPSRFDRKYHFDLPGERERALYIDRWNARLTAAMRMSTEDVATVAAATEAFSFAYLKELFAASLMRFANEPDGALVAIVRDETDALRRQMQTVDLVPEPVPPVAEEGDPYAMTMRRGRGRRARW